MNLKRFSIFSVFLGLFLAMTASDADRLNITLERMKTISQAIEKYLETRGELPPAQSIEELAGHLATEIKLTAPLRDGWGRKFHYISRGQAGEYWLGSNGSGQSFDGFLKYILKTGTSDTNIILANGSFINLPDQPSST